MWRSCCAAVVFLYLFRLLKFRPNTAPAVKYSTGTKGIFIKLHFLRALKIRNLKMCTSSYQNLCLDGFYITPVTDVLFFCFSQKLGTGAGTEVRLFWFLPIVVESVQS